MALRSFIIVTWLIAFGVLNVISKHLVGGLSVRGGVTGLLRSLATSPALYGMLMLYGVCALLYLAALRLMPISSAGPIFTIIGTLVTFALGAMFFGEAVSSVKALGLGLCIAGVLLLFWQTA